MAEPRNAKKNNKRRKHTDLAAQRFVLPKDIKPIGVKKDGEIPCILNELQQIRIFLQRTMGYRGEL